MEAARIAAQRGHSVTLYEKNGYLGGMLSFAEAIKGGHEHLSDLRAYLERQLELAGVTVVTGTEVTRETVDSLAPDAVILAVGGTRAANYPAAVGMDDFMGAEVGESVVILGAGLQATDLAMYLIAQGKKVQLINDKSAADVDAEQSRWVRTYVRAHLYAHGVKAWNDVTIDEVTADNVTFTMSTGHQKTLACDTVIDCLDMQPNMALYQELESAGYEVHAAGCDSPKNIQSSIHAGYKVARYL